MALLEFTEGDLISPDKVASTLLTTKKEIGETMGIPGPSLSRKERIKSPATQRTLRHLVEVLIAVKPLVGNFIMAYAWFRSEPLVGFGGRTPDRVVKDGEFDALRTHIQRRIEGGYA